MAKEKLREIIATDEERIEEVRSYLEDNNIHYQEGSDFNSTGFWFYAQKWQWRNIKRDLVLDGNKIWY